MKTTKKQLKERYKRLTNLANVARFSSIKQEYELLAKKAKKEYDRTD